MPMLAPRNTSLPFTENGGDRVSRIRFRHVHGVFGRAHVAEDQRKPVAAAARKRLGLAQTAGQPLGRELDQSVPGQMPQRVVDAFEAVQIQTEQRGHPLCRRARATAWRNRSSKTDRLGRPVNRSCVAWCASLCSCLALADVGEQLIPVTLPVAFMDVHRAARPRVWKHSDSGAWRVQHPRTLKNSTHDASDYSRGQEYNSPYPWIFNNEIVPGSNGKQTYLWLGFGAGNHDIFQKEPMRAAAAYSALVQPGTDECELMRTNHWGTPMVIMKSSG